MIAAAMAALGRSAGRSLLNSGLAAMSVRTAQARSPVRRSPTGFTSSTQVADNPFGSCNMLSLRLLREVRQARQLTEPRCRSARVCASGSHSLKSHLRENSLGHSQPTRTGAMDPLFEIELDMAAKGSRESSRTLYGQLKAA